MTLDGQPDKGRVAGFEFARDALNAKRPMQPAEEIMLQDIAAKPKVMADQRRLLESRYDLTLRLDSSATMSRGEPLVVGPPAVFAPPLSAKEKARLPGLFRSVLIPQFWVLCIRLFYAGRMLNA
jgi:hypothetical protein